MKTIVNFDINLSEIKTPTDGRTYERKWLINRTKEVRQCKSYKGFGFFDWLRFKDIETLTNSLNNLN